MPQQETEANRNRPFHEIRQRSIRATIWLNETSNGPMFKVTVSRLYRDGDQWKDTNSFGYEDLMNVAKVLFDAHTFISAQEAAKQTDARTH
jgi:hypothetical protein